MFTEDVARRNFLKMTGAGIVGLGAPASLAGAEGNHAPAAAGHYHVRVFGAKGDGKTLDTPAVNKAIEVAAAAGGGIVRVSAGGDFCYSVHLKSNIGLVVGADATIVGPCPSQGGGG